MGHKVPCCACNVNLVDSRTPSRRCRKCAGKIAAVKRAELYPEKYTKSEARRKREEATKARREKYAQENEVADLEDSSDADSSTNYRPRSARNTKKARRSKRIRRNTETVTKDASAAIEDVSTAVNDVTAIVDDYTANQELAKRLRIVLPLFISDLSMINQHNTDPTLLKVLFKSPYKGIGQIHWQEYNSELSDIINANWMLNKDLEFTILKLFSGALLIDGEKGLFIICTEIYSRFENLDVHCEQYSNCGTKSSFPENDLNQGNNFYNDLCIMDHWQDNLCQLKIGLRTSNLLVVGSKRIDDTSPVQLGPSTEYFVPSKNTRLFFNADNLRMSMHNMEMDIPQFPPGFEFNQLRHLRTKFDDPSTYSLRRAIDVNFYAYKYWPLTIWTFAYFDDIGSAKNSTKKVSSLFVEIARAVFLNQNLAYNIVKKIVDDMEKMKSEIKKPLLNKILDLFNGKGEIEIINNEVLSSLLRKLANSMQTEITTANQKHAKFATNIFEKRFSI